MRLRPVMKLLLSVLLLGAAVQARAVVNQTLCVFDIVGASGDTFNIMKDYKAAALNWGVNWKLKVYTDEKIAAEDLKAGVCDASAITGIRARQFNKYTGSLDSVGSIPNYKEMHTAIQVLASGNPSVNKHLHSGPYEVIGIGPMGAAYLFVKDRTINTVGKLSGKSIAVMEYDKAEARMASKVGMSPVLSDITNFAGRFNNGSVDVCFAPIAAYSALELYKGMKPNGGIIDFVLGQLTMQVIAHSKALPPGFGDKSRQYFAQKAFPQAMRVIDNARDSVNKKWWVHIPEADAARYDEMLRESRISMTRDGIYDADMMSLLRKIRCKYDSSRAECVNPQE